MRETILLINCYNYFIKSLLTNEKCEVNDNNWPGVLVGTFGELFIKSVICKSIKMS